jgi:putative oxidoreductase
MLKQIFLTDERQWASIPLRVALGLIFITHGGQKLFGWLGGKGLAGTAAFFGKMGLAPGAFWAPLAGFGEFIGGLLVVLGLCTRLGALSIAVIMIVAILRVHWGAFFLPGGAEYAFALLGAALALLMMGGGRLSLDLLIQKKMD